MRGRCSDPANTSSIACRRITGSDGSAARTTRSTSGASAPSGSSLRNTTFMLPSQSPSTHSANMRGI